MMFLTYKCSWPVLDHELGSLLATKQKFSSGTESCCPRGGAYWNCKPVYYSFPDITSEKKCERGKNPRLYTTLFKELCWPSFYLKSLGFGL